MSNEPRHEERGRITIELTYWQASALLFAAQQASFEDPEVNTAAQRAVAKLGRALTRKEQTP